MYIYMHKSWSLHPLLLWWRLHKSYGCSINHAINILISKLDLTYVPQSITLQTLVYTQYTIICSILNHTLQAALLLFIAFVVLLGFHTYLLAVVHVGTYDWLLGDYKNNKEKTKETKVKDANSIELGTGNGDDDDDDDEGQGKKQVNHYAYK